MLKKLYHYLLSLWAYLYYGRPSRQLIVVGVTGTKGKSTTCRFIASVLEAGGFKVGLLSTVEFQVAEKRWLNKRKMTMLGRGEIHKMLRDMVRAGCQYAVVETSSEGILQYRHKFLNYDIAVFTNLGTEHSERHGGFENLKQDKGKLFAALSKNRKNINGQEIKKVIVVNGDDINAQYYLNFPATEKVIFHQSDYDPKFKINIVGDFNIPNVLAAIAVGRSQNISEEKIKQGIGDVKLIEGRMEFIDEGQLFKVVVDYAHEPMSLSALFDSLNNLKAPSSKLIAIIGSDGGGRDKGKRAKMGEIAGKLCDIVIITDVNCFDEDPKQIAEMLAVGARQAGKQEGKNLFIEVDRRQAIAMAIRLAESNDVVAITAKGTEPCMVVAGDKKLSWDDREVARAAIKTLKY
ncbi:MAG: UDP-N-acetylmuramyl-tripeptide synthetase [Candidatus Magasanikbacteria bacterium]